MIGEGFKKLGRTPVPKLPSSYPAPPPPEKINMENIPKIQKELYPHIPKIDPSIPYPIKPLDSGPLHGAHRTAESSTPNYSIWLPPVRWAGFQILFIIWPFLPS